MQHIRHGRPRFDRSRMSDEPFDPIQIEPISDGSEIRPEFRLQQRVNTDVTGGATQLTDQQLSGDRIGNLVMPSETLERSHQRSLLGKRHVPAELLSSQLGTTARGG